MLLATCCQRVVTDGVGVGMTNGRSKGYHAPFGRKKERNGGPPGRRGSGAGALLARAGRMV
jgi:hypothetical protein